MRIASSDHVRAVVDHLSRFHVGDERLGVLLSLCVGRLMLHAARHGEEWREIATDPQLSHIADWLKAATVNRQPWLGHVDERDRPRKLMKFGSVEAIVNEADKAMLKAAQRL